MIELPIQENQVRILKANSIKTENGFIPKQDRAIICHGLFEEIKELNTDRKHEHCFLEATEFEYQWITYHSISMKDFSRLTIKTKFTYV